MLPPPDFQNHHWSFDFWQNQWSFMLITIIYAKYWIHRLKELGRQDDVLAGKLPFYQGCVPYEADQDGGMDGKCREIHFQNHGWQSLHFCRIQKGARQLSCKFLFSSSNKNSTEPNIPSQNPEFSTLESTNHDYQLVDNQEKRKLFLVLLVLWF